MLQGKARQERNKNEVIGISVYWWALPAANYIPRFILLRSGPEVRVVPGPRGIRKE